MIGANALGADLVEGSGVQRKKPSCCHHPHICNSELELNASTLPQVPNHIPTLNIIPQKMRTFMINTIELLGPYLACWLHLGLKQ